MKVKHTVTSVEIFLDKSRDYTQQEIIDELRQNKVILNFGVGKLYHSESNKVYHIDNYSLGGFIYDLKETGYVKLFINSHNDTQYTHDYEPVKY